MDLKKLINDETEKYITNNLSEVIQKHLDKMMESIIWDIFSSWGDNAKEIKKQIGEKIKINLTNLDLMDYNWIVATSIDQHFKHLVQERSVKPVLDILSNVVGVPYKKDTITFDDLFEEIKDIFYNDAEYWDEIDVPFYARYNSKYEWVEVWTDTEDDTRKEDCKIRFIFKPNGNIFSLQFLNYKWSQNSPMDIAHLDKVEEFIHKLYTSWVKIKHEDFEDWDIEFDTSFTKED